MAQLADDHARADLLLATLGPPPATVAAYLSTPDEPGTVLIVDALRAAGVRVLVPLLRREPDWAAYEGRDCVREGRWGIPEPTGPALGAVALAEAAVVLVPGLLGTPRGERLGRGGGWYDRALLHRSPDTTTVLLLNDDEVVAALPTEPHDLRVAAIVTARRWLDCRE